MNSTRISSADGLSSYVSALLSNANNPDPATDDATAATPSAATASTSASARAAANKALASSPRSFKNTQAQHTLEQRQAALAKPLRTALAGAGVKLEGTVEFSVGADGKLAVKGSAKDQAAIAKFLKSDTTTPGFSARLTALAQDADKLSASIRQGAALSQAARHARRASDVSTLYNTIAQRQDTTDAVFALSTTGSSLAYPGVLASTA